MTRRSTLLGLAGVAAIAIVCLAVLLVYVRSESSPPITRAQALHSAWLAERGRYAPTKWGMHLLLDDGEIQWPVEVWDDHLAYTRVLVGDGGYALQLVRLGQLDIPRWQYFIDRAIAHGLKPMIRLASYSSPEHGHWTAPPKDSNGRTYRDVAQEFARFIGSLSYPEVLYVTVGNEPNRGDEWGGSPNPAEYAQFLVDVSDALHAVGRGKVLVLNGALDQYAPHTHGVALNGFEAIEAHAFLDAMHAAVPQVWDSIDIWASHSYPMGPFQEPPSRSEYRIDDVYTDEPMRTPPSPGIANRGINSYRSELLHLERLGVTRFENVLITESGWRHRDTQGPSRDSAGATISSTEAAANLIGAFYGDGAWERYSPNTWTPWMWDPDVQGVVLFALGGAPWKWGHTNYLDVGDGGQVLGLKPGFAELVRQ
jgi:hypothetical protein